MRDDEGGDEEKRDAIERVESYEAEKDTEGADKVEEEEATLGSDVDKEESSMEESSMDFAELTKLCTSAPSRMAQARQ